MAHDDRKSSRRTLLKREHQVDRSMTPGRDPLLSEFSSHNRLVCSSSLRRNLLRESCRLLSRWYLSQLATATVQSPAINPRGIVPIVPDRFYRDKTFLPFSRLRVLPRNFPCAVAPLDSTSREDFPRSRRRMSDWITGTGSYGKATAGN